MSAADTEHTRQGPPRPPRRAGRWIAAALLWAVAVLVALIALLAAAGLALDTAPGRRFVAARVAAMDTQGLRIQPQRIDGSIYGRMVLRDVVVRDAKGPVVTSPAVVLDWSPLALLNRHVLVNEASADLVRVLRRPVLKPSKGKSKMPSLTYTVKRLAVSSLVLEPALVGERRAVSILASADLPHGRALVNAEARAQDLGGGGGGDLVLLKLDAEAKANRLQLSARVLGPKGGIIDRLLKLGAPVALEVNGRGDWRDWRGRAWAAVGGESVLDAGLGAQNGRFTAVGEVKPGRLVRSIERLTSPVVRFDLAASVQGPRVAVEGRASSDQFTAQVAGAVDRDRSLVENLRANATLLEPSALSPQLSGRDVRLALRVDGPFATPLVDYDLSARSLGYGNLAAESLSAHGRSVREADGTVRIPVSLTAARLTGLSKSQGPLVNVSLNGPVVIRRNGQVSADLQLRSAQLQASLTLQGSQRTRTYAGALRARAAAAAVNQFGLGGVLGGGAAFGADFASSPDVLLRVSNARLEAPRLRVTSGEAAYRSDGRISLAVSALTSQYGPLRLTAGGTLRAVRAHLSAPGPLPPVPITKLEADLGPVSGGYRLIATGASPYGPLAVDSVIGTGAPLTLTLTRARLGDLGLTGTVSRTAQGPFGGVLTLVGSGLDGTLRLSGQGSVQAAQLDLRAANASLPLAPPVTVRSGRITASVALYPGAPALSGHASFAGVQRGGLSLTSFRGQLDYRRGVGRASLAMAGDSGAKFQLAAAADLAPTLIRVNGRGSVEGVSWRLAQPAQVMRQGAVWRLEPATVLTSGGRMVLGGSYGRGASASAELDSIDLKFLRAVRPDLGISGKVSGRATVDLPAGAAPSGRLALQVTRLTHTGATTVSEPIDINLLATLTGSTGEASAVLRQHDAAVGRLQARLTLPAAGAFAQRLRAASLDGGLRYNGSADALSSLVGVAGQDLSGSLAIGADVSGPLEHPQVRGVVMGRGLDYRNAKYGTHITGIELNGRFAGTRFELVSLTGSTGGDGRISGSGYADLSAANGWPIRLDLKLDHAQLAQSDQLGARLFGTLAIANNRQTGPLISGDLALEDASYQVTRPGGVQVADLKGVRWQGQPLQTSAPAAGGPPSQWRLDIRIRAPNRILVNGMGLESEWRADLRVRGDINNPRIVGDVRTVRGTYSFGGRKLTVAQDSVIHFTGSTPPDPTLDITASADVNGVTAGVTVGGIASNPQISFTSTPDMPQDEVLSVLLFGSTSAQLSTAQALQLAASLNSLRGGGGLGPLGKLSRAAGLQNLRFQGANKATGQGVAVGAGRYITNRIYADVITDVRGYTATQIEVALSRALSLLTQVGSSGSTGASIRYTHRY